MEQSKIIDTLETYHTPMRSRVRMMVRIGPWLCVACFYLFGLCFDISCTLALGNKYVTISPSLPCFFCLALFAPVCLHLHYRTPFRHPPPLCYFSLSSLSSTEDQQDKMHQGFHLGDQLPLKTFAIASSTKCNPIELCLPLKDQKPIPRPLETSLESLTMSLTYKLQENQLSLRNLAQHWVHYGTSGHSERAHCHPKIAPKLTMP